MSTRTCGRCSASRSEMDDRELARRLAAIDQAKASVHELAAMMSDFYRALVRSGVPRSVASTLTRDLLQAMTSGGRPSA